MFYFDLDFVLMIVWVVDNLVFHATLVGLSGIAALL